MTAFLEGIEIGGLLALLIGPIFVTLIQNSVEKGFRAGLAVAAGVWISDLCLLLLTYFGLQLISTFIHSDGFTRYVGTVGSLILIAFGISSILRANRVATAPTSTTKQYGQVASLVGSGLIINMINPFTILFWLGIVGSTASTQNFTPSEFKWFAIGAIGTVAITDIIKILLAKLLRKYFFGQNLVYFKVVSGVLLIGFGVYLCIKSFGLTA